MQKFDLDTVTIPDGNPDGFRFIPNGGYICRITKVTDVPGRNYLDIEYDIADGEYRGFASDTMERAGFCPCRFFKGYEENRRGYFKKFTSAVEASNRGYRWDWNEQSLVGKYVGLVIQEEEKINARGYTNVRPKVIDTLSVDDIKNGFYKKPERKKADGPSQAAPAPIFTPVAINDGDLPF